MSLRRSSGRILSWLLRAGKVRTGPPRLSLPPVGTIQTRKQSFKSVTFPQVFFEKKKNNHAKFGLPQETKRKSSFS